MVHTCTIGKVRVYQGESPPIWRLVAPDNVTVEVRHSAQILDTAHELERLYDCRMQQAYGIRQRALIVRPAAGLAKCEHSLT